MSYRDTITVGELAETLAVFKPDTPVKIKVVGKDEADPSILYNLSLPFVTTAAPDPLNGELVETRQGTIGGEVVVAVILEDEPDEAE